MDGGREKILVCETEGSSGTGSSDNRDCLGWQSASYRCEYNGVSVGVDFDAMPYTVTSRSVFVPPMRIVSSGTEDTFTPQVTHGDYTALRPVDVRSSPADESKPRQ